MAPSFASVPLLQKKALSAKELSTRRLASSTWGTVWNRLLVWESWPAWAVRADSQVGSPWPRALTAIPGEARRREQVGARERGRGHQLVSGQLAGYCCLLKKLAECDLTVMSCHFVKENRMIHPLMPPSWDGGILTAIQLCQLIAQQRGA